MSSKTIISLAVVGHTNTGKTSLLRTLTRDQKFGEVSDRPSTTREVSAVSLLVDSVPVMTLFDTPGLEDPMGLMELLEADKNPYEDPVARIDAFLATDHGAGSFEQEAKVLRQLRKSDAALYVIDAREPMLAKHREELRLLAECGRPLMPVLNFVASPESHPEQRREGLARMGLHVLADFDTVGFEHEAERSLFAKLEILLDAHKPAIQSLARFRDAQRALLVEAACRTIADMLIDVAGLRVRVEAEGDLSAQSQQIEEVVCKSEQTCVDDLLTLFQFDLGAFAPPELPLEQGQWALDPFDPEALKVFGVRTGSAIAAGATAGVSVDAMLGGASLGAGALLGAGAGTFWSFYQSFGKRWVDELRGYRELSVEEQTLALLSARQIALLHALLRRGHASTSAVEAKASRGWVSKNLREAVMRARAHPDWSALNCGDRGPRPDQALVPLMAALRMAING